MQKYSQPILRTGLALVFFWFAYQQITNTEMWTRMIPEMIVNLSGLSASTLVLINAWFEIIFGLALLLGFCTRIVALLLALHLLDIAYIIGFNATGVRDFGLAIATFSIFLHGPSYLSLDNKLKKTEADTQ
jgi:uncharacterized membrane protein YphA (DoxX/SURF4 family)